MGGHVHVGHGLGGLQAQQAAANDGGALDVVLLGVGQHALQVLDGPVDKDAGPVAAGDGRDEGEGSRGHDGHVVVDGAARGAGDGLGVGVDGDGLVVEVELYAVVLVPLRAAFLVEGAGHGDGGRIARLEVRGELDAVVGGARLLAEGGQGAALVAVEVDDVLHQPLPHHAVADHHHLFLFRILPLLLLLVVARNGPEAEGDGGGPGPGAARRGSLEGRRGRRQEAEDEVMGPHRV